MKVLKIIKIPMRLSISATVLAACMAFLAGCYYDNQQELYQYVRVTCDSSQVTYSTDILAILDTHCLACHSQSQAAALGGNISLSNYTEVKTSVNNGSFYGSIIHENGFSVMPPSGQKIPDCDIVRVKSWIDAGAPEN